MDKLISLVPNNLKRMISQGTSDDLLATSSSLLDFFLSQHIYHNVVRQLMDPELALCGKNRIAALDLKRKGNDCFSAGDYNGALSFYSQALRVVPMDEEASLVSTLYVNRASTLHKMGLFAECLRDCDRAIFLSPSYTKAWYRRGKANASLENYDEALNDMDAAMNLELLLGQKSQIKNELELIVKKGQGSRKSICRDNEKSLDYLVDLPKIELECISTADKGRGMISVSDIPEGSLIHSEEPYAMILSKQCRETLCHFCLKELPVDTVPCSHCSIALYCSQWCQVQAGGQRYNNFINNHPLRGKIPTDSERYVAHVISASNIAFAGANPGDKGFAEHKHECGGISWPAVLPSEIILAGRMMVKSIEQRRQSEGTKEPVEILELCHNYEKLPSKSKLEFHLYSVVLTHCLQQSYSAEFPLTGASVSQLVTLMSQVKINSMAIIHMKSIDAYRPMEESGKLSLTKDALTNDIEQVRVGQAIYSSGSLFNHSCQPNIHSYFLSRTLFMQSTEFVPAGCPLELSYGPQVGQWNLDERQLLLEDQYSFKCSCRGCSEMNFSDIVISSFSCKEPNCFGTVLDANTLKLEKWEYGKAQDVPTIYGLKRPLPIDKLKREDIKMVARGLFKEKDGYHQTYPGYCLTCGSYRHVESLRPASLKAMDRMKRLQDVKDINTGSLSEACSDINLLRSTLHAYNKEIAQAEDNLAKALCSIGDFKSALNHCKASIEILEKLYHSKHIVIGNEIVKLASIQLCMGDHISAMSSINRIDHIFSLYYGSHVKRIFPYLENLKKDAAKLAFEKCILGNCSSS